MRETILLRDGWLFHEGELPTAQTRAKGPVYMQAKTEAYRTGPAAWDYRDTPDDCSETGLLADADWQPVRVPHDYIITQTPQACHNFTLGGFAYRSAWYRYHFCVGEADRNKRVAFYFEAVATGCRVFLNGCPVGENACGYTSFEVDVTDFLSFERENVLAVHVNAASPHEGWWYEGAGLYRPVWLVKTAPVCVDRYGVYIHPERQAEGAWDVPVEVTVHSSDVEPRTVSVETTLQSPLGETAAVLRGSVCVPPKAARTLSLPPARVSAPLLWDTDSPQLYTAVTRIYEDGALLDEVRDRFGFRTIYFDADKGFFLNGRHTYLYGVNCHQDYGLTGKAVPARVQRYKLKLLRRMGANAFRACHYPHSAQTMDALDEMGFLVWAETRSFSSSPEGRRQLEMLVKRDRNHPCVILWSVGNEEPLVRTQAGLRITQTMKAWIRQWDATRPVTAALCHTPSAAPAAAALDVLGINYNLEEYEPTHQKYPALPLVASECCASGTTRGWYGPPDAEKQYLPAYDRDTDEQFLGRERTWRFLMAHPYIMGCFQWDGIEHRGEAQFPRLCSQAAAIDLYLQPKDAFYQNQSHWTQAPMIHLLPHWNWTGHEGEAIRVVAYTNCDVAELFLNGRSLGRQALAPYAHAEWSVPYAPGTLRAVGLRQGAAVCADEAVTSGPPARLVLSHEEPGCAVYADGDDTALIVCTVEDAAGNPVPDAEPEVSFTVNELGTLLGTGSDVSDPVPPQASRRSMRAGRIALAVRAGETPGVLYVWARAVGLSPARLALQLERRT